MKKIPYLLLVGTIIALTFAGCKAQEAVPPIPEPQVEEPVAPVEEELQVEEEPEEEPEEQDPKEEVESEYLRAFTMNGEELFTHFNNRELVYQELNGLTFEPYKGVIIHLMNEHSPFGYGGGRIEYDAQGNATFWGIDNEEPYDDKELQVYWIIFREEALEKFMGSPGPFTLERVNEKIGQTVEPKLEPFLGEGVYEGTYETEEAIFFAIFEYEELGSGTEPVQVLKHLRLARPNKGT